MNATKDTLLGEVDPAPVGLLWVLNKIPEGMELPLWRLSCNFSGSNGDMYLAMEDKGTPHVEGGSSSPMRAKTATLSSR